MTGIEFDSEKIDRFFKGEYSDKDASYVDEVFCDKNKEKELEHHLRRQWLELSGDNNASDRNLDQILYKIHYDINTMLSVQKAGPFDNLMRWTLRIAGVLIIPLLIILGIQTYKNSYLKKETWVEIKAPAWTRAQFVLPDGTTGWLNSNSSIKYNGEFIADRKITLKGEAFFDVSKDAKRPFVVNTNEIKVTVLGTQFNIASYENEKTAEVVLEEGKLMFNDREMRKSYTMKPNDLIVYDKILKDFSTEIVQPQKYISWTEGKLVFRNDPLDVIARRLERWYNIDVEVNVLSAEGIRWRATFIDESLEEVLNLMKRSLHINYQIENRELKPDETFAKKKVIITNGTK
jgi:transmembrane sensor